MSCLMAPNRLDLYLASPLIAIVSSRQFAIPHSLFRSVNKLTTSDVTTNSTSIRRRPHTLIDDSGDPYTFQAPLTDKHYTTCSSQSSPSSPCSLLSPPSSAQTSLRRRPTETPSSRSAKPLKPCGARTLRETGRMLPSS
jgi:hypothetical protein